MKKYLLLSIYILFSAPLLFGGSGGPDKFGYTWKDSNEPGGPVFSWVDITTNDRKVWGLGDDNMRGPFNIANAGNDFFTFYWYQVDKFWIGSNGYISFGNINLSSPFPNIPDSTDQRHNFIAGLLADLTFSGPGNPAECYYKVNTDSIIVSFINVPFYSQYYPSWTGSNTFQIILNKVDKSITINFASQSGTTLSGDIRTGIENITGNIGLQPFAYTYPTAGYSIRYEYPSNTNYFVADGAALWNTNDGSRGLFLPYPSTFNLKAKIGNTGNLNIPPPFYAYGMVKNQSNNYFINSQVIFNDTLQVGKDTIFNYPVNFNIPSTGTYTYITRLAGVTGDAVNTNDSIMQELVAIDTSSSVMMLNFSDNIPDWPGISWVDGTGGLGVYFIPPTYPVKINATRFYIEDNPNNAKFIAKILDDDGPNGTPGTLLDSVFVSNVFVGGYNNVQPSKNIVIYNGGVYVGWEMYGTGITLAKDINPPISYRTYEFINNIWSEYRTSQSEDFLIGLTIQKHHIEDIGVSSIVSPLNNATLYSPTPVTVWIKNFGQQVESNFTVSYKMWGQNTVTETYNGGPINIGDSVMFTFNNLLFASSGVAGPFSVWTTKANDYDVHNDTAYINLSIFTTNITEETNELSYNIQIKPNPVSSKAIVKFYNPYNKPYQFTVMDITGRILIKENNITGDKVVFDRTGLTTGIYLIELKGDKRYVKKVIVE